MNGLMLHCGGQLKTKEEVFSVPVPAATESYVPLPHESFVKRIERELAVAGICVTEQRLALAKEGQRLFGLMQVEIPNANSRDYGCVIGLRNSYDKSCASGICMGASVFVCDNLSFQGADVTFERRHTPNLLRDLAWIITETVEMIPIRFAAQSASFESYRATELSDREAHDLTIRFYDEGAINVTHIPALLKEWREPRHPEFSRDGKTAWRLFNAATEVVKGDIWRLQARTGAIHKVLDTALGLTLTNPSKALSTN